ncbi:MAG: YvrJ protein family protein [Bacteriophage sp.]|nr:MAG: YvrJ protein family protein [Bacteriophage sp.]
MEQWIQIISTYGVSIAAMIALAVYIVKKDKENQAVINEIMNEHKTEVNELRKTIENNTLIVTKLYERLSNEK